MASPSRRDASREAAPLLEQLREIEYETLARDLARRDLARERIRAAVRRLGELGSPETVLRRAAALLGAAAGVDRLLLSQVLDRHLVPISAWDASASAPTPGAFPGPAIELAYPLAEAELLGSADTRLVHAPAGSEPSPARRQLCALLGSERYAAAPVLVGHACVGMLHIQSGAASEEWLLEAARRCADGLAQMFELAVLRRRVHEHGDTLRGAVRWMEAQAGRAAVEPAGIETRAHGELTQRERDVLELVVHGMTNAAIARRLLVAEGTVKYHLANAYRKLGAASRADAAARYLRTR